MVGTKLHTICEQLFYDRFLRIAFSYRNIKRLCGVGIFDCISDFFPLSVNIQCFGIFTEFTFLFTESAGGPFTILMLNLFK